MYFIEKKRKNVDIVSLKLSIVRCIPHDIGEPQVSNRKKSYTSADIFYPSLYQTRFRDCGKQNPAKTREEPGEGVKTRAYR